MSAPRQQKVYKIATSCEWGEQRRSHIRTYTLWYNEAWSGLVVLDVTAATVREARRKAVDLRLELEKAELRRVKPVGGRRP